MTYLDGSYVGGGVSGELDITIPVPTAVVGGTLALIIANDIGQSPDPTSDGFTLVDAFSIAAVLECNVWLRVVDGSEPTDYTFTYAGATSASLGALMSYVGVTAAGLTARQKTTLEAVGVGHQDNDEAAGANPVPAGCTILYPAVWVKGNNNVTTMTITPDPGVTFRGDCVDTQFGVILAKMSVSDLEVTSPLAAEPAWAFDFDYDNGAAFRNSRTVVGQTFELTAGGGASVTPGVGVGASAPMVG